MEIIIWMICGFVCYLIAEKQKRNVWLAAILGCIFGIIAIIGYLIAGDKKQI